MQLPIDISVVQLANLAMNTLWQSPLMCLCSIGVYLLLSHLLWVP